MVIVIDSREQRPLDFGPGVQTVRAALAAGDYSILGLEHQVAVERKSLGDLLSSITHERERFERELRILRPYRFKAIVIESTWAAILMKQYSRRVSPMAVVGTLAAYAIRYGVNVLMAEDHDTAALLVHRMLAAFAREVERDFRGMATAEAVEASAVAGD
jgi:ERCC4-type nuclease